MRRLHCLHMGGALMAVLFWFAAVNVAAVNGGRSEEASPYRSPWQTGFSPDGRMLAASDHTAARLTLIDVTSGQTINETPLRGRPAGIAWSDDGQSVYVAECGAGTVAQIDTHGRVVRRIDVGPRPVGLAIAPRRGWLLATNSATGTVSVVNLATGQETKRIVAGHMPYLLAVSPDERLAVVGNRLPLMDASDPAAAAMVTLIDLESLRPITQVRLPANSTNVHGVAISPDGRWAYLVHNLGRAMLPTEQIEYGWINANAMTTIDLSRRQRYATILLDRFGDGAANPWGVGVSPDGKTLWITLSGVHQVGRLDLPRLHRLLAAELPKIPPQTKPSQNGQSHSLRGSMVYSDSWQTGIKDRTSVEVVISDLPAEYGQGRYLGRMFFRSDVPGNGPRGLAIARDGKRLAVASYFSGTVSLLDTETAETVRTIALANQPEADDARRGEMVFHDARRCFENWLSCATCHPDGRADGLNWDLLNDGIGNPKNTRSMLLSHRTPPATWRGIRPNMEASAAAGFSFMLFQKPRPSDLPAVHAYLRSLRPAVSPYRTGGRLSSKAQRGKTLFESRQAGCSNCHPAPLYTDRRMHDVGTRQRVDEAGRFDTPTLIEVWRTPPYLHHGRATTFHETFTKWNEEDRHGKTSHLSDEELECLAEYLRSL